MSSISTRAWADEEEPSHRVKTTCTTSQEGTEHSRGNVLEWFQERLEIVRAGSGTTKMNANFFKNSKDLAVIVTFHVNWQALPGRTCGLRRSSCPGDASDLGSNFRGGEILKRLFEVWTFYSFWNRHEIELLVPVIKLLGDRGVVWCPSSKLSKNCLQSPIKSSNE